MSLLHRSHRRGRAPARLGCVLLALAALVVTLLAVPASPGGAAQAGAATTPLWGLAGSYSGISTTDMYNRGVRLTMVELKWANTEKSPGVYDESYLTGVRDRITALRSKGFQIVLNFGMHHAPTWLLNKPNARFTNQNKIVYKDSDEANLIFATELRPYAERYTAKVFSSLGTSFFAVRVGGGHWGELQYPGRFNPTTGKVYPDYWAFDAAAARTNPVPGWRPGSPSPNGEARRFANWYLQSLSLFQNWQIATVRKSYPGTIGVLYASWGLRTGDLDRSISTNLNGTSSPEINGEMQRGYDHARHIRALSDPNVAAWGTWGEKEGTLSWLAGLADAKGIKKMGENSGQDDPVKMARAVNVARTYGLSSLMWIRAAEAYCSCNGYATIADYQRLISTP